MIKMKFIAYFILLTNCSAISQEKRVTDCLPTYVSKIKANPLNEFLRLSFYDSLKNWNSRSISMVEQYKNGRFDWELDQVILFNHDSTRAILFLDKVFKDNHNFDLIKTIPAEKIDGKWWFYYKGYVELAVERSNISVKPHYKEISILIVNRFIEDGMAINGKCEFYYKFIDTETWFSNERRMRHFDEFLQSK